MEAIERADEPDGVVVLMDLGQCGAQRRAGAGPAPRRLDARTRDALVGADRRRSHRGRRGGRRRSQPRGGRGGGARRAHGQVRSPVHPCTRRSVSGSRSSRATRSSVSSRSTNLHGLHARPAARLVSEVRALDASVQLRNLTTGAGPVAAGSLSRVATLAALHGHEVEVRASGPQAQEAVEHLLTLARRRFDETADEAAPAHDHAGPVASARTGPLPASPGIAIGPGTPAGGRTGSVLEQRPAGEPAEEWRRLVEAVATVASRDRACPGLALRERSVAEQASIFDAHLSLLSRRRDARRRQGADQRPAPRRWPPGTGCVTEVEQRVGEPARPLPEGASGRRPRRRASRCRGP